MRRARLPRVCVTLLSISALSCTVDTSVAPPRTAAGVPAIGRTIAAIPPVRFSEIHYDNGGTDVGEAIEISGPAGTDLTGYQVVLYNGTGGASYNTTSFLGGVIPATCDTRGVVVVNYPSNGIQNGSPDGFALVDATGTVIEFLSYEGTFVAVGGPANGLTSVDIGVAEAGTEPVGQSLQRSGAGTWSGPITNTFGACNDSDVPPPPPVVVSVVVTPATATVTTGFAQQFHATAFDAANQPIAGVTFTWSSSAPAVATVDGSGLATTLAPGDAQIVAAAPNGVADTALLTVVPPSGLPDTRFSEIHYDNTGIDVGEAIEIEGPAGTDVTGWSIVLYNGDPASRTAYSTQTLTGVLPDQCDGRGVLVVNYPSNGIQNGSPDGFALADATGRLVEFLSYEGTFTAVGGPADGVASTDLIAFEPSTSPIGVSLQRDPFNHWSALASTFGLCNGAPPPPPSNTITFTGRVPSDPALPVGFEDQLFATLRDGTGAPVPTTFTWSSDSPAIASIDQDGVFRALAAGTATLRATAAEGTTATIALPTRVAELSTTAQYAGNAEFGEPTDGDPSDDFILRHVEYTASYNPNRGTPNWVSYDLDASHFGPEDRCDCFTFDPDLPAAVPHYTTAAYTGAGAFAGFGIDRGHLARSFDRTAGSLDNAFTFLFSNIVPQAADLNQGPWAVMENALGDLARFQNKEVYIVAGVAGSRGTLKNEGKITIPASTWKVAVILPRDRGLADVHAPQDLEIIAVIMPNEPGIRNVDWHTYQTTVDVVETASGYDLLAALPDWIERIVEANDHYPTANAGGPYTGVEGSAVGFSAAGSTDPDGDILTYAWDFGDGASASGATPLHAYADNGVYTATVIATDPYGAADTATATVTVDNAPPVITSFVVPSAPVTLGSTVTVGVTFTDPGGVDTHTITVDWGDGTAGSGMTHVYGTPGLYAPAVTVRDDDGGADTRAADGFVVVYDPNAGFVTGSGWIPTPGGKAKFALVARYQGDAIGRGASVEFSADGSGIAFASERIDWLVLSGPQAKIQGVGTISGRTGMFNFLVTALDDATDGFRIKIWNAGGVVFDNQPGARDDSVAVTALGGGNISVKPR